MSSWQLIHQRGSPCYAGGRTSAPTTIYIYMRFHSHTISLISALDCFGTISAFISTWLYARISIFAWPIGLVAMIIDTGLYFKKGIYGDVFLQLIYIITTFYGWWQWLYGGEKRTKLPITSVTPKAAMTLTGISLIGVAILVFCLKNYTNSQIPYWDAATTTICLIAQWMMCRKIIQCWVLWFITDASYAILYFYKHIPYHAGLQIIYLVMAVVGYLNWRKFSRLCQVDCVDLT